MDGQDDVLTAVREWVASIGYPRGCLSPGGLDEASLVRFVTQQRDSVRRETVRAMVATDPDSPKDRHAIDCEIEKEKNVPIGMRHARLRLPRCTCGFDAQRARAEEDLHVSTTQ